jgi:hypothetical protein
VKAEWNNRYSYVCLTVVFVASRFLFWAAGVQFYGSFAHRMWQLLDLNWLRTNFLESIWYCHAQPPLFNTLTALVVKTFPDHYYFVFHVLMLLFSWATSLLIFSTLDQLKVSKPICFVISIFFLLNPALVLYENLYSYTLLTIFLIASITFALVKVVFSRKLSDWGMFASLAAVLCLTRSAFHFIWLALVFVFLWRICQRDKKFITVPAMALLLVFSWYVKNLVLFGSFSSSSWFGMNIARVIQPHSSLGQIGPFKPVAAYDNYIPSLNPYPRVAALSSAFKSQGYVNFNHYAYLNVSAQLKADVVDEIQHHPGVYIRAVGNAFVAYFNPSTHAPFVDKNFVTMDAYARWLTFDFTTWTHYDRHDLSATAALPALLIYILVFGVLIVYGRAYFRDLNTRIVVIFLTFMITYGMLVGNLFEYGENNRFRFETHTCFLVLAALALDRFFRKFRNSCTQKDSM